jgi:putative GTP pyrophosphokinase
MDSRDLLLGDDARKLYRVLEIMKELSFRSGLGLSLKKPLAVFEERFELWEIQKDFADARSFYRDKLILCVDGIEARIKAPESVENKMLRTQLAQQNGLFKPFEKSFNDLIGFRIILEDYDIVKGLDTSLGEKYRLVDMTEGKATDDGYRGLHIYYQPDHQHYPVELQLMTERDRVFNMWLHENTYKIRGREAVGGKLRQLYDKGVIRTEKDFKETLNVIFGG